ncbi:MAG TPA: hypothetical protein VLF71_05345 [Candidatus Saccharimonadales bacterium]|nr:hypothetical protein [Candidatus Saccharimonadales bacterium]
MLYRSPLVEATYVPAVPEAGQKDAGERIDAFRAKTREGFLRAFANLEDLTGINRGRVEQFALAYNLPLNDIVVIDRRHRQSVIDHLRKAGVGGNSEADGLATTFLGVGAVFRGNKEDPMATEGKIVHELTHLASPRLTVTYSKAEGSDRLHIDTVDSGMVRTTATGMRTGAAFDEIPPTALQARYKALAHGNTDWGDTFMTSSAPDGNGGEYTMLFSRHYSENLSAFYLPKGAEVELRDSALPAVGLETLAGARDPLLVPAALGALSSDLYYTELAERMNSIRPGLYDTVNACQDTSEGYMQAMHLALDAAR